MPIYEYICGSCGKTFEKLVGSMKGGGKVTCPDCGKSAKKQFSSFAAHVSADTPCGKASSSCDVGEAGGCGSCCPYA